jgi:ChaB
VGSRRADGVGARWWADGAVMPDATRCRVPCDGTRRRPGHVVRAHDSAVAQYGAGERAHRTAFAALKHSFEKVGDYWEPKKTTGPSDSHAAREG